MDPRSARDLFDATCGYQVAARNANGDSAPVRDLNVGTGIAP
jgi:hypothetical protein